MGAKLSEIKEKAVEKYYKEEMRVLEALSEEGKNQYEGQNDWLKYMKELQRLIEELENIKSIKEIDKINVIRADSEPSSNYVVCNRICQQMQLADLIVVDVSNQNPNVFTNLEWLWQWIS